MQAELIDTTTPDRLDGKEFERLIIAWAERAERDGVATMSRYGVQGTFVMRDDHASGPGSKRAEWRPVQSLPDFEGVLNDGRQFIVEAKVCSQASFPLSDDKFKARQLRHLLKRGDFGVFAILLIHYNRRELKTGDVPAATYAFPVHSDSPLWIAVDRKEVLRLTRDECDLYGFHVPWIVPPRCKRSIPDLTYALQEFALHGKA
jgi:penicillin-binding protein-related factor A (putative recombinase)